MDFDKLIKFYEKNASHTAVFGEKPSRNLRVAFWTAGYEFFEEEWILMESKVQIDISSYILEEMKRVHYSI